MPPKANKVSAVDLTKAQIELLRQWIDEGGKSSPKRERVIAWEPLPVGFKGIYAVSLSADGDWAACSRGGQVFVYHLPTQRLVARLTDDSLVKSGLYKNPGTAHRDIVPALDFSPDGRTLVTGSFSEVKLWTRDDARQTAAQAADATRAAYAAALAAKRVVVNDRSLSAEKDGKLRLTDSKSGTLIREFKCSGEVFSCALNADGTRVAVALADKTIKLWNAADGALLATLKGDRAAEEHAAERTRFAAFLTEEIAYHKQRLKDAEADKQKLLDRVKKVNEDIKTADVAISPKEKALEEAKNAEVESGKSLAEAQKILVEGPPAAEDAKKIKEAGDKQTEAKKKTVEAGVDLTRARENATHQRVELKLANDAMTGQTRQLEDVKRAVAAAEEAVKKAEAEKAAAMDSATKAQAATRAMAFSSDGSVLAAATDEGVVQTWGIASGLQTGTLAPSYKHADAPLSLAWQNENLTATWKDGSTAAWSIGAHWNFQRTLGGDAKSPMNDRVNALRFSPDGKLLVVGSGEASRGGEVTVWNVADGRLLKPLADLHKDAVLALDFRRDGKLLATGAADRVVKVIDTSSWKTVKAFEGHTSSVLGVAWRYEGRTLASAGADGVVKIWDYVSGDRRKNLEGWEGEVTSVQFAGYSGKFIVSSADKHVRMREEAGGEGTEMKGI